MNKNDKNVAIIGASGAIGEAFVNYFSTQVDVAKVYAFSRSRKNFTDTKVHSASIDLLDEASIKAASETVENLDCVMVTTGILHDDVAVPEKALKDLNSEKFQHVLAINTIGPALVAKYFTPRLHKDRSTVFAAISARVGSISDNQLGGWYAYRASKAALNMFLKTASIELKTRLPKAIVIGLHPGTVDSALSKPFQSRLPEGQLFTPDYSVSKLVEVLEKLETTDSGKIFAWDGEEIPY